MKRKTDRRIHNLLDGEAETDACTPEENAALEKYQAVFKRMEKMRVRAPSGLKSAIMTALPRTERMTVREWLEGILPQRRQWAVPALAGALATLIIVGGVRHLLLLPSDAHQVTVHFQIHAPGAERVDLVGDFNNWATGAIRLSGPDASGHWTADVELPEGRYEYQFLVDGKTWITDPSAAAHRPDGFGRDNAVLDVYVYE